MGQRTFFFPAHTQHVVRLGNFSTKVYIIQRNAVLGYEKENSFVLHRHLIRQITISWRTKIVRGKYVLSLSVRPLW